MNVDLISEVPATSTGCRLGVAAAEPSTLRMIRQTVSLNRGFSLTELDGPASILDPVRYRDLDVVLFSLNVFLSFGRRQIAALEEIRKTTKVILMFQEEELIEVLSFVDRCDGFLFTDRNLDRLVDIVDLTMHGYCLIPARLLPELVWKHIRLDLVSHLSSSERQVLSLLGSGMTNRSISDQLGIPDSTVKNLVRSVLKKLHFRNRTEAGVFAMRQGFSA